MSKKLPPGHSADAHKDKVGKVMHEWKHGALHSGTGEKGKKGPVVKNRKQAIAIAISESKHAERLVSMGYSEEAALAISSFIESQRAAEDADEGPTSDIDSTPGKQKGNSGRKKQSEQEMASGFPTLPKQAPGNNNYGEGPMVKAKGNVCPTGTKAVGGGYCRNTKPGKRQYFEIEKGKSCPPGSRSAGAGRCRVDFAEYPGSTGAENAKKAIESTPCSQRKKKDPNAPKKEVATPTPPTKPTEPVQPKTPEQQMLRDTAKKRAQQCAKQQGN